MATLNLSRFDWNPFEKVNQDRRPPGGNLSDYIRLDEALKAVQAGPQDRLKKAIELLKKNVPQQCAATSFFRPKRHMDLLDLKVAPNGTITRDIYGNVTQLEEAFKEGFGCTDRWVVYHPDHWEPIKDGMLRPLVRP